MHDKANQRLTTSKLLYGTMRSTLPVMQGTSGTSGETSIELEIRQPKESELTCVEAICFLQIQGNAGVVSN